MLSATDELRRLLDERGVEHYDGTESTLWLKDEHGYRASADELTSGRLSVHIWCDTPEQAIAATLVSGTCENVAREWEKTSFAHAGTSFCCSECGAHYVDAECYYAGLADKNEEQIRTNYCPNCGRRVTDVRQSE